MSGGRTSGVRNARFSRRAVLRAALGATLGLPWLETFVTGSAGAVEPLPRCFVAMFSPNGTVYDRWAPTGTESNYALSSILAPLEPHRGDIVVVDGVNQRGDGGDQHQRGIGGMLTGEGLLPGTFGGAAAAPSGWADGPSVDQRIAESGGGTTPFRSLELGVQVGLADNYGRMCYRAKNRPLTPREDPSRVFDDVFGASLSSAEERERRRIRRSSVLDVVRADLADLRRSVGSSDRERLDAHFTLLREVEARLDQTGSSDARALPSRPEPASSHNDDFPRIGELQMDLLVLALASGRTRVASLQWSRSASKVRFPWLGIAEDHHQLSHRPDTDADAKDKLVRINQWYAGRFAGLVERLKKHPEGAGTLLDRCLLLWCNELGKGNTHSREPSPYVLAGRAGGAISTGRWLRCSGDVPHNDLLLSVLRAFQLPDATFGRPEWCTGPLPGLL